jgi:hypothetical protein
MSVRHSIIRQARADNELVYDFNQRNSPQFKSNNHDFCAGLALKWLALRNQGWDHDYPYDETTKVLTDPGDEPLDLQDVYEKQGHLKAFDEVGFKRKSNETTVPGAVQPGRLVQAATDAGMYFLRIRHKDTKGAVSGHAVAFRSYRFSSDGRAICYFDANLGSFYFGNSKIFQDWFNDVISKPLLGPNESYEQHYAHEWILYPLVVK